MTGLGAHDLEDVDPSDPNDPSLQLDTSIFDQDEVDAIADELHAAATGDHYPATMADGYDRMADPDVGAERTITIALPLKLSDAAAILARERGIDQVDVYDVAMTLTVLTEATQRAISADLGRTAEAVWVEHLRRLDAINER